MFLLPFREQMKNLKSFAEIAGRMEAAYQIGERQPPGYTGGCIAFPPGNRPHSIIMQLSGRAAKTAAKDMVG